MEVANDHAPTRSHSRSASGGVAPLHCRDHAAAQARFDASAGETGAIWTRTGRAFFNDAATTEGLLARLRGAVGAAGLWDELSTDWLLLDAEIMPCCWWQYKPVFGYRS